MLGDVLVQLVPDRAMQIRNMTLDDLGAVTALWDACGLTRPWNDLEQDIRFALAGPASTGLVGLADGTVMAALLVGHDGHRGSVYYVGVHPDRRGHGFGGRIMAAAEDWLRAEGVWKLNLLVRKDNDDVLRFYKALGYADQETISLGKRLDGRPDRTVPDVAAENRR